MNQQQRRAPNPYSQSLIRAVRRPTREVRVGSIGVGGSNPIRIESMTTTDTMDIAATVAQSAALAAAGCEIVRIATPNVSAARALREIRRELDRRHVNAPLVADVHFLPSAAMEAIEHVENVRINPGNYADRKKFAVREYSDAEYNIELQRLYDAFSPLVKRCRELGRSMRIGANHGSLSDRIMNRYGDTPMGMVESALEFLRIAESHGCRDIILSVKASNPKVMIQANRLLVDRMDAEDMPYPLHLGVTEAGDGEDGRIKSAIGIGSLLADGIGDTIRVSLSEDPLSEIPVARALAGKIMSQVSIQTADGGSRPAAELPTPYEFNRRAISPIVLGADTLVANDQPPRVFVRLDDWENGGRLETIKNFSRALRDMPIEGVILPLSSPLQAESLSMLRSRIPPSVKAIVLELGESVLPDELPYFDLSSISTILLAKLHDPSAATRLESLLAAARVRGSIAAIDAPAANLISRRQTLQNANRAGQPLILTLSASEEDAHAIGGYRRLATFLRDAAIDAPIWIRNTADLALQPTADFLSILMEGSIHAGSLLCDGIGDLLSIETESDPLIATRLTYNILQGSGARISKTEFVACPGCGRTLFDLQETIRRIREKTGHLKGVKIAIMGCIVNGPGEMADADFGYVGGSPGHINLYAGKECVEHNIPTADADRRLIDLIRRHGKWIDPDKEEIVRI